MLSPAERRRARDFNARVSARRGAERRSRHTGQHAAGQHAAHAAGVHRASTAPDEVGDLVVLADRLGSAGAQVTADDEFRDRLRQRLIAVASVHGINAEPGFRPPPAVDVEADLLPLPGARRRVPRRVTVVSGTLAGLVALSGVGFASGGANPGDALYGVKRSRETAQLTLARSAVARGQLHLEFARNRLTEAAAATGDQRQLVRLLDDMDTDTRAGMADLGTAAATQHHPAPLDLVDEFALAQRKQLSVLAASPTAPSLAVTRIRTSLALVDQVERRSTALRNVLHCTEPFTTDGLGPVPHECAEPDPDEDSVPSDEPTTPWPARPRSNGWNRTSESPTTAPTGGASGTTSESPAPSGRRSSATTDEDDPDYDPTLENLVPQSGSVLPTSPAGTPTDPLVGSVDDTLDTVVGSPLVSDSGRTRAK